MARNFKAKFELEHNIPEVAGAVKRLADSMQASFSELGKTGNLTKFNSSVKTSVDLLGRLKEEADIVAKSLKKSGDPDTERSWARLVKQINGLETAMSGAERNVRKMSQSSKILGQDVADALGKGTQSASQKVRNLEREFSQMTQKMGRDMKKNLAFDPTEMASFDRMLKQRAATIKGQLTRWQNGGIAKSPQEIQELNQSLHRIRDLQMRSEKTAADYAIREAQRVANARAQAEIDAARRIATGRAQFNARYNEAQAGNLRNTMGAVSGMMHGGMSGPRTAAEARAMREQLVAQARYGPRDAATASNLGFDDPVSMRMAMQQQARFLREREAQLRSVEGMGMFQRMGARFGMNRGVNMRQGFHALNHRITNVAQLTGTSLYGLGAFGAASMAVTGSVKQSMEAEQIKTVLAGLLNQYVRFKDETGKIVYSQENFNRSLQKSQSLYIQLRKTADDSILTTREMLSYFTTAAPFGFKAGLNEKQISHVVERVGTVGSALGLRETDVTSDIRNLLSQGGRFDSTNKILLALGITGKDRDKALAGGPEEFMKYFNERFAGLEPALAKFTNSFTAKWSAFIDHIQQLGITVGDALIPELLVMTKDLDKTVRDWVSSGKAKEFGQSLGKTMSAVGGVFTKFIGFLSENVREPMHIALFGIIGILSKFTVGLAAQQLAASGAVGMFLGVLGALVTGLIMYSNKLRAEAVAAEQGQADTLDTWATSNTSQQLSAGQSFGQISSLSQATKALGGLTTKEQQFIGAQKNYNQWAASAYNEFNRVQVQQGQKKISRKQFDTYIGGILRNTDNGNIFEKGAQGYDYATSRMSMFAGWNPAAVEEFDRTHFAGLANARFALQSSGVKEGEALLAQRNKTGGRAYQAKIRNALNDALSKAAKSGLVPKGFSVDNFIALSNSQGPLTPAQDKLIKSVSSHFMANVRNSSSYDINRGPAPVAEAGSAYTGPSSYRDATPVDLSGYDARISELDDVGGDMERMRMKRMNLAADLAGRGFFSKAIGILGNEQGFARGRYTNSVQRINAEFARQAAEASAKQTITVKPIGQGGFTNPLAGMIGGPGAAPGAFGGAEKLTPEQRKQIEDEARLAKQNKENVDKSIDIRNELSEIERKKNRALEKAKTALQDELEDIDKEISNIRSRQQAIRAKNMFDAANLRVEQQLANKFVTPRARIALLQRQGIFSKMEAIQTTLNAAGVKRVQDLSPESRAALQNTLDKIDAGTSTVTQGIREANLQMLEDQERGAAGKILDRSMTLYDRHLQLGQAFGPDKQRMALEFANADATDRIGLLRSNFNSLDVNDVDGRSAIEEQIRTQQALIASNRQLIMAIDQNSSTQRLAAEEATQDAYDRAFGNVDYTRKGSASKKLQRAISRVDNMGAGESLFLARKLGFNGDDPVLAKNFVKQKMYGAAGNGLDRAGLLDQIDAGAIAGLSSLATGGGLGGAFTAMAGTAGNGVLDSAIQRFVSGKYGAGSKYSTGGDMAAIGSSLLVSNFLPKNSYSQEGSQIGGVLGGLLKGVGPFGGAIGILAGGLLGSLFGKKKTDPALEAYKRRIADLLSRIDKNTRPVGDYYRTKVRMFQSDTAYLSGRSIGMGDMVGAG